MEYLSIKDKISDSISLPVSEDDDEGEKMGWERLGSENIFDNFGVTLIFFSFVIAVVSVIVGLLYLCSKQCNFSPNA